MGGFEVSFFIKVRWLRLAFVSGAPLTVTLDGSVKLPSEDVELKAPVWEALGEFFLDNEPHLEYVIRVCSESPYSLNELDQILFSEVWPALSPNLASIAESGPGGTLTGFPNGCWRSTEQALLDFGGLILPNCSSVRNGSLLVKKSRKGGPMNPRTSNQSVKLPLSLGTQ